MKLQLYILRQILVAFAFAVGAILVVATPGILVSAMHKVPQADAALILGYLPLVFLSVAPYVLPMSFLLATVATYGRLAGDGEWTAMQMAGVSPARLFAPGLGLAAVLSAGTYWVVAEHVPLLKTKQKALLIAASSRSLGTSGAGGTSLQLEGFILEASRRDPETGELHDVYIRRPASDGQPGLDYYASSAVLLVEAGTLTVTLEDLLVVSTDESVGQSHHDWIEFDIALEVEVQRRRRARFRTTREILRMLAAGVVEPELVRSYRFQIHYRYVVASAFLLFFVFGAPIGLLMRHGSQLAALAVSSGCALVFYLVNLRGAKMLEGLGSMHPAAAAWGPSLVCLALSIPLLWRGTRH